VLGLRATVTDILVRVQMLESSCSLRLDMLGTTWAFVENTSVIRLIMLVLAWVSS
jgi:hypothetical protein